MDFERRSSRYSDRGERGSEGGRFEGSSYGQFNDRPRRIPPVKEGETYEVVIESIGGKGDGIAKYKNYVIVIPGTKVGDRIKVKITAVRGKVSFGEVVETLAENVPVGAAAGTATESEERMQDEQMESPAESPQEGAAGETEATEEKTEAEEDSFGDDSLEEETEEEDE